MLPYEKLNWKRNPKAPRAEALREAVQALVALLPTLQSLERYYSPPCKWKEVQTLPVQTETFKVDGVCAISAAAWGEVG